MTGAILNAAGILVGGLIGLSRTRALSPQSQTFFKLSLGVFTVFYGLRLTWLSINGSFLECTRQFALALLAMILGRLLGKLLRLQTLSNRLGRYARQLIENARPNDPQRVGNGMNACAILFCASPLGLLGALQDGLSGYFYPLAVKAVMDGLAMLGFVMLFGWGALLAAVPVLVFLGTLTLGSQLYLEPFLRHLDLINSVNAVGGLVLCAVAVVIFELRKVELAEYLPALAVAPLLTSWWR